MQISQIPDSQFFLKSKWNKKIPNGNDFIAFSVFREQNAGAAKITTRCYT